MPGKVLEITSQKQLEELISKEKEAMTNDTDLKKKYAELEKQLQKNITVRDFYSYLTENEKILPNWQTLTASERNYGRRTS